MLLLYYSKFYIRGYGLNSLRKYNKTKINTVEYESELLKHTKSLYENNILDIGHENREAFKNFMKYCNESKYDFYKKTIIVIMYLVEKWKKDNISRSTISNILKEK